MKKSFLNKIKMDFAKILLGNIALNVIFLIFGLIIYTNPYITINTVGIIIGIYFIIFGLFYIYEYLMRKVSSLFVYKIVVGILTILLGLFVIINPFKIVEILTFVLGLYLIIIALNKLLEAFKLKKYNYDGWSLVFVSSILLLIFGIFITFNPMASIDLVQATGIFIILSSILEICNLFMIYSKSKDIVKLFKKTKK